LLGKALFFYQKTADILNDDSGYL